MSRRSTVVCGFLAVLAGAFSIVVNTEVQERENRLERLNRDIADQIEAINVLRAEWSYLNRPARLEDLARRHLGLQAPMPHQVMQIAELPFAGPPDAPESPPVARPPARFVRIDGQAPMTVDGRLR